MPNTHSQPPTVAVSTPPPSPSSLAVPIDLSRQLTVESPRQIRNFYVQAILVLILVIFCLIRMSLSSTSEAELSYLRSILGFLVGLYIPVPFPKRHRNTSGRSQ